MSEITDTMRLNFIELHPDKNLRPSIRGPLWARVVKWAFIGFTNYPFEVFPTVREAIDHAIKGYPE